MTRYLSVVICVFFALVSATPAFAGPGTETTDDGYKSGVTATDKDPVSMGNGELIQRIPLISLGGPMGLDFSVDYNSNRPTLFGYEKPKSPFSAQDLRWNHNRVRRLVEFNDLTGDNPVPYINYFLGDETVVFKGDGNGGFESVGPIPYQMKKDGDISWLADPERELVHIFRTREYTFDFGPEIVTRNGELLYTLDRNGNMLTYAYNEENLLTFVSDGLGRMLDFTYVVNSLFYKLVDTVSDGQGRNVTFDFSSVDGCSAQYDFLSSITDPIGNKTTIDYTVLQEWECDYIHSITRPLGNTPAQQAWDANGRVSGQIDAMGNTASFAWNVDSNGIVAAAITDPDATQRAWSHAQERYPTAMTDGKGKSASVAYDADNRMTGLTDREGDTTVLGWHADSGRLSTLKNAEGHTLSSGYTARRQTFTHPVTGTTATFTFYDRNRVEYPDGSFEIFVYDDHGNLTQYTDPRGKIWSYTYNSRGQTLTAVNPEGGVTSYTYNLDDATLATRTDSDTGTTTYGYDSYKRLNLITRPNGKTVAITYDLNDRITSVTDESGNTVQYAYDANGNQTRTTDAAGNAINYGYDLMDRVSTIDDRLNKRSSVTYDSLGRVASTSDANGLTERYAYNSQGWLSGATLGGKTWQTAYDNEGIPTRKTDPSGFSVQYQSDKIGFTTGITNELGHKTVFTRDSLSRITDIADPLNRITRYRYDAGGNLAGVTLPGGESATYSRNGLGLLSAISDPGGNIWGLDYTTMGRFASLTDPLDRKKSVTYDNLGRRSVATLADDATVTYTYDPVGNLTRELHSDGPDLTFTYDKLNHLTAANGIELAYDAEGHIIDSKVESVSFAASYDDGGRIASVGYNNGAFSVTYTYNATTGLLDRVTDTLTGTTVDFAYDENRRLRTMNLSNGEQITYTWDDAGRMTRIQSGNSVDLIYTLDAAGQVSSVNMTAPLDPAPLLQGATETFAHDQASQISSTGYAYDPRGRLTAAPSQTFTWDGASRLAGINGVSLAYNGLGDLVTRDTTRYYCNKAIGLSPIVAEKNDTTGAFLRYYVWTPSGRLLYMIDAGDGNKVYFYHFDRTGNTLALTDGTGAVADSYAYTPYGRLLGHNGSSTQPFTFVGQWGVRQEGSSGALYHARARYYDAETGRFLSREPLWPRPFDVYALNPYQYAACNPVMNIDSKGLSVESFDNLWKEYHKFKSPLSDAEMEMRKAETFWNSMVKYCSQVNDPEEEKTFRENYVADEFDEGQYEELKKQARDQLHESIRDRIQARQELEQRKRAFLAFIAGKRAVIEKCILGHLNLIDSLSNKADTKTPTGKYYDLQKRLAELRVSQLRRMLSGELY